MLYEVITTFQGVPGRMQRIPNNREIDIIVDFAHTPNGLKQALSAAKEQSRGKLIAVFV